MSLHRIETMDRKRMLIRRASETDGSALHKLFNQYRAFYEVEARPEDSAAFIDARLSRGDAIILIGLVDVQAAGFCQIYPTLSSLRLQSVGILNDLFVAPDWRGRGLGRSLLEASAVEARALGMAGLSLQTASTNHVAQELYLTNGWCPEREFMTFNKAL